MTTGLKSNQNRTTEMIISGKAGTGKTKSQSLYSNILFEKIKMNDFRISEIIKILENRKLTLEDCLNNYICFDENNNYIKDIKDIYKIVKIDLSNLNLTKIPFFKEFKNIKILVVDNNNLNSLNSLKNYNNLEKIHSSNNNIELINLNYFQNLKRLYIDNNPLKYSVNEYLNIKIFNNNLNAMDLNDISDISIKDKEQLYKNYLNDIKYINDKKELLKKKKNFKIFKEKIINKIDNNTNYNNENINFGF